MSIIQLTIFCILCIKSSAIFAEDSPLGNGYCDVSFNNAQHGYDGGDCCPDTCQKANTWWGWLFHCTCLNTCWDPNSAYYDPPHDTCPGDHQFLTHPNGDDIYCEATCEIPNPELCVQQVGPSCRCPAGTVWANHQDTEEPPICIPASECPAVECTGDHEFLPILASPDEDFCSFAATCEDRNPPICLQQAGPICRCPAGTVLANQGEDQPPICLPTSECPVKPDPRGDLVLKKCGSACTPTCDEPNPICTRQCVLLEYECPQDAPIQLGVNADGPQCGIEAECCPGDHQYLNNADGNTGNYCEATCEEPNGPDFCIALAGSRCRCPAGTLWANHENADEVPLCLDPTVDSCPSLPFQEPEFKGDLVLKQYARGCGPITCANRDLVCTADVVIGYECPANAPIWLNEDEHAPAVCGVEADCQE